MKKLQLYFLILLPVIVEAQNTWTQKANIGAAGKQIAVGFSIGGKGYFGTGQDSTGAVAKDFWEYDPLTDVWTQKSDFGGVARSGACGFSVGAKGYIGTGEDSLFILYYDFWEYDPATNSWARKADFPGTARMYATGFSIGSFGYIGLGVDSAGINWDFWKYNPVSDSWNNIADFPGPDRYLSVGFSIGNKGYVGTGTDMSPNCFNDFWEYDPSIDLWTPRADFGGVAREGATGFSIGTKGYILGGEDLVNFSPTQSDVWEYNSLTDTWKHRTNLIPDGSLVAGSVGFSIAGKGYVGSGEWDSQYPNYFWEYTPDTSSGNCSSYFTISPDSTPHLWVVQNNSNGTFPISYSWSWGDGTFSSGNSPTHTYTTPGYYNICLSISDSSGCVDNFCDSSYLFRLSANSTMVSVYVVNTITGLNNVNDSASSFIVYPNPAQNEIKIENNEKCQFYKLYDITGNLLVEKIINANRFEIDLSLFKTGIYFLIAGNDKQQFHRKIIKE